MGRKIPGKKHRTVKDPYQQRVKRLESERLKVNNPPTNADEQEIPKSLLNIIKLKRQAKETVVRKPGKKRKGPTLLSVAKLLDKEPNYIGTTKPDKYIPNLVQKPNESAQSFLKRLNIMTQHLINEVEFEKKFGVEIKRNQETGEVVEVKSLKKKYRTSKKKTLSEKRKEKFNEKKESLKDVKDFYQLKDNVEFGEVVHEPPNLSNVKKKNNKFQELKFSNLLLNDVVKKNTRSRCKNSQSNLDKERIEIERKFIVDSYRKLKQQKLD